MTDPGPKLISVVMPSYNHAAFIGRTIGSVLGQTYSNFELIIVDNHSQDGTEAVVAACKDPRIKYVKFSNNGVIAASRNHGVGLSRGEYVAFVDSDDLWLPEKLEKQMEAFLSPGSPVMVYSRYKLITGDAVSEKVLPEAGKCAGGDIFKALYLGHFIACSGVMVKKKVLDEAGGFDETPAFLAVEDMDLWLRLALAGPAACACAEPLFLYRVHPGNLSRGYLKKYKRAMSLLVKFSKQAGFFTFARAAAQLSFSVLRRKLGDSAE